MICAALITAGGTGERMRSAIAKQYLDLAGVPILARTIEVFQNHPLIEYIVLTVPLGDEERCRARIVLPYGLKKVRQITGGGPTRQASVYNGLQELRETDMVVIHDGVRPLVTFDVITKSIEAAQSEGAAVVCSPVRETVKRKVGALLETVPRDDLWLAHTPQTFKTALILQAHEKALADGFHATDDAVLVERLGHPVAIVQDAEDNVKITTPADLERARRVLERRVRADVTGSSYSETH